MGAFSFHVIDCWSTNSPRDLAEALNEVGLDGYRLVATAQLSDGRLRLFLQKDPMVGDEFLAALSSAEEVAGGPRLVLVEDGAPDAG